MTKTLDNAIEKIRTLPPERQDYAASVLEQIVAASDGTYRLSDDERVLLREGLVDLDAGRIVPDAEMAAFWNRHGE